VREAIAACGFDVWSSPPVPATDAMMMAKLARPA